jgi:hypothetical protein
LKSYFNNHLFSFLLLTAALISQEELACTVIQFQGNWLPEGWGSGNILISKTANLAEAIRYPFLTRKLADTKTVEGCLRSSQVCNGTLFQLGLALIELSLCRPMSSLQNCEERKGDKIAGLLLTADRCLPSVHRESGMIYYNVVHQCLIWAKKTRHIEVESDEFQACVLVNVVNKLWHALIAQHKRVFCEERHI